MKVDNNHKSEAQGMFHATWANKLQEGQGNLAKSGRCKRHRQMAAKRLVYRHSLEGQLC